MKRLVNHKGEVDPKFLAEFNAAFDPSNRSAAAGDDANADVHKAYGLVEWLGTVTRSPHRVSAGKEAKKDS